MPEEDKVMSDGTETKERRSSKAERTEPWPIIPPSKAFARTKVIVRIVVPMMGGVDIVGAEKIPTEGPIILAPSHRSSWDPPYLTLLTERQQFYMAKEQIFKVPVFGNLCAALGAFPVKRGEADRAALRKAMDFLKNGQIVTIFPEGTRSVSGELKTAEKGFALIARQTGAVIVPVAVEGTQKIAPKGSKFLHRNRVQLTVGDPITAKEILASHPDSDKDALSLIGEEIMSRIAALRATQLLKS
jgi:1-acyl-sn-glycerol-3-phosphate acyltransferase